jgi:hypothetical protein
MYIVSHNKSTDPMGACPEFWVNGVSMHSVFEWEGKAGSYRLCIQRPDFIDEAELRPIKNPASSGAFSEC